MLVMRGKHGLSRRNAIRLHSGPGGRQHDASGHAYRAARQGTQYDDEDPALLRADRPAPRGETDSRGVPRLRRHGGTARAPGPGTAPYQPVHRGSPRASRPRRRFPAAVSACLAVAGETAPDRAGSGRAAGSARRPCRTVGQSAGRPARSICGLRVRSALRDLHLWPVRLVDGVASGFPQILTLPQRQGVHRIVR